MRKEGLEYSTQNSGGPNNIMIRTQSLAAEQVPAFGELIYATILDWHG